VKWIKSILLKSTEHTTQKKKKITIQDAIIRTLILLKIKKKKKYKK